MTAGERELPTDEECREQNDKRSEWLIETLIARDFDIPEFHALQVEIGARWRADRRQARAGCAAPPREPVAQPVAWEHNNPITGARFMTYEERPQSLLGNRELWNTRPLYAAPVGREGRLGDEHGK